MGTRGRGYGSEDHLRRWLQADPESLSKRILGAIGGKPATLTWLSYPPRRSTPARDRELTGIEFLDRNSNAHAYKLWQRFWPQRGTLPSWDAIGRLEDDWLLVEAKANAPEFCSKPCDAKDNGRKTIAAAMSQAKRHLGVHRAFNWLGTYYQYANRLALLYFLAERAEIKARLIFLYFLGDQFPDARPCPATEAEWRFLIDACHRTLGLPEQHRLASRIHDVFVPVRR